MNRRDLRLLAGGAMHRFTPKARSRLQRTADILMWVALTGILLTGALWFVAALVR